MEPMPKKQFRRMVNAFKRHGGKVYICKFSDNILEKDHAEGSTFNATTIMFPKHPSRAAVFEEFIHATQYRLGQNDGSYYCTLVNEIEAKEKLLRNRMAYKLTKQEIIDTRESLERYRQKLEKLRRGW